MCPAHLQVSSLGQQGFNLRRRFLELRHGHLDRLELGFLLLDLFLMLFEGKWIRQCYVQ